jgi:hypothetical protein
LSERQAQLALMEGHPDVLERVMSESRKKKLLQISGKFFGGSANERGCRSGNPAV